VAAAEAGAAPAAQRAARLSRPCCDPHAVAAEKGRDVSRSGKDLAGGVFGIASLVLGILQCFWVPFAFAPASLACLVIALMMSPKYKGLYDVAAAVLAVGVVVGGIVAVVGENPLY
jgi:hypothetical protein